MIADIARELGRRADVPVSITPPPTAAAVLDAVRSGQVDIGCVAPNPERTGSVLYSRTYMLVQESAVCVPSLPGGNVLSGDVTALFLNCALSLIKIHAEALDAPEHISHKLRT